jgi:drug/metabolite transporter (DMT)-like permease
VLKIRQGTAKVTLEGSHNISREKLGLFLGFIGMCLFAGTLPATRIAIIGFDPWFLTVARAALAGSTGLIVVLIMGRRLPPRSLWLTLFGAAFCSVLCFPLFAALAMMTLPATHGGIVQGILPLATAAAAAIFAHERPSAGFWWASAIGAVIVLTFVFRQSGGFEFSAGDIFLLGTVVAGAIGYTLSGRLAVLMPGWEVISWQVVLFLPLASLATLALWPADIASVSVASWGGLGYAGFISQYTAFCFFNTALAMGGISRIGQIMLLQPFVIIGLAQQINKEPIQVETVLFAVAVVATVLIGQRMRVVRH